MGGLAGPGLLQNEAPLDIIRLAPARDLCKLPETTQTDIILAEAAIAYAGRLNTEQTVAHVTR